MRLTLHIFRKDARRCWKEVALTLGLLAWLTRLDSWRSGYLPDSGEGWLNVLVPLAWAWLVAVCILQDPVPGERQFWLTLPCRRRTLFAAKALFIVTFIHAPYLLSNAFVLEARGFAPWRFVPQLAEQQGLVLLGVTLPALALATLARGASRFIVTAIALLGAAIVSSSALENLGRPLFRSLPWLRPDRPRQALALLTVALFAVVIAWIQYRTRRTELARSLGVAGVIAAALLYALLPAPSSAAVESWLLPARLRKAPLELRFNPGGKVVDPDRNYPGNAIVAAIPVEYLRLPAAREIRLESLAFEILGPEGARYKAANFAGAAKSVSLVASLSSNQVVLSMEPALFASLANTAVMLHGTGRAEFHRDGSPVPLPERSGDNVPDVGSCFRSGANGGLLREDGLRVVCEFPGRVGDARARLVDTETGREWEQGLGISVPYVTYPSGTWLSPVDRRESYFQLTSREPGSQWQAPKTILAHSRTEVIPRPVVGQSLFEFRLTGIHLRDFVVRPQDR